MFSAATVEGALTADSADDVCSPSADPCEVTDVVNVVPGSVLDFGVRAVSVTGNGKFNFAADSGRILCGPFAASTATAIDATAFEGGELASGNVTIIARRACSADPAYPCLTEDACDLGFCSVRRCSGDARRSCTSDLSCKLGQCLGFGCAGNLAFRCSSNADCDLGACGDQLTCSGSPAGIVDCSSDADCDKGACSIGEASILMDGAIAGSSAWPAFIRLQAADSISISKPVNLSGKSGFGDGGELEATAFAGSVTITDRIRARGGSFGGGGYLTLAAAEDVVLEAKVNLNGGDFSGGILEIDAGRDVRIEHSVLASSTAGSGSGGIMEVDAEGDILLGTAGLTRRVVLQADGHIDRKGFAGDGGFMELVANGNIVVPEHVSLRGNASRRGSGGDIHLSALGNLSFDGHASASAYRGPDSHGGSIELDSAGLLTVGNTASFEAASGLGGGELQLTGDAGVDYAGSAELSGPLSGANDDTTVRIDSDADVTISGKFSLVGDGPHIDARACRITLTGTAALESSLGGLTELTAYESIRLLAGSRVETHGGTNRLRYRTADKPPVIAGTLTPAATLEVIGGAGCPVCGNSEIDDLETCDDGNVTDGDGCSSLCLIE